MTVKLVVTNNFPGERHLAVAGIDPSTGEPDGTPTILAPGGAVHTVVHAGRDLRIAEVPSDRPATPGTDYQHKSAVDAIARVCHEVNRGYCAAYGDYSQPAWDDAPDWQKDSARLGVEMILKKPETKPSQSHESWYAQKEADGWVYGEVKDAEKKTHPCMVPYDQLPREQQVKDYVFGAVVRAIAQEQVRK